MSGYPKVCLFAAVLSVSRLVAASDVIAPDASGSTPKDYSSLSAAQKLGINFDPIPKKPFTGNALTPVPGVLLMPIFMVKVKREELNDKNVLTDQANLDLAKKKYLSPLYRVTFGPLSQIAAYFDNPLNLLHGWHPNDAEARILAEQDRRLERLSTLDSMIDLESTNDPKVKQEMDEVRYEVYNR